MVYVTASDYRKKTMAVDEEPTEPGGSETILDRLAEHRKWLDSDGAFGQRLVAAPGDEIDQSLHKQSFRKADLSNVRFPHRTSLGTGPDGAIIGFDFREVSFDKVKLKECHFVDCDFKRADLKGANLKLTEFQNCNFRLADLSDTSCNAAKFSDGTLLRDTKLERADLHQANLKDAAGLTVQQLGGTDVSRATLPDEIAKFSAVDHAQEISRNARTIFLGMIGGCVFSWLTIGTTTDAALLTNAASTPLPIIGTNVPIAYFFLAAPVILLALFVYLHLYLQKLWSALADLPAKFPDGRRLDECVYPWLLTSFATAHTPRLAEEAPVMSRFQVWLSVATAWLLVPVTCSFFWARFAWAFYAPALYPLQAVLSSLVLGLSIFAAYWFYRHAEATFLRMPRIEAKRVQASLWPMNRVQKSLAVMSVAVIAATLFVMRDHFRGADFREAKLNRADLSRFDFSLGYFFRAEGNGASFDNATLDGAVFAEAILQRATFRYAKATSANFIDADLTRAELFGAKLEGASFYGAKLNGADLGGSTVLTNAEFQEADLTNANFRFVDLTGTSWHGAKLAGTDLTGAILSEAEGLTQEMLDETCANPKGSSDNQSRDIVLPQGLTIKPCRM